MVSINYQEIRDNYKVYLMKVIHCTVALEMIHAQPISRPVIFLKIFKL